MAKTLYLVKDLARLSGHSVYTVEHYLRMQLIKETGRSPHTNYRYFDDRAVEQLATIRRLRAAGRGLEEIRTLLKTDKAVP